jgi:hypothetical protein
MTLDQGLALEFGSEFQIADTEERLKGFKK